MFKPFTSRLGKVDSYIRKELRKVSPYTYYHGYEHTLGKDGVVECADRISKEENVSDAERELIVSAAYFHDVGFVSGGENHEWKGVEEVKKILPGFGYTLKEIECISELIMATMVFAEPTTHAEEILRDADVDNLGREDFFEKGELLRKELCIIDKTYWYEFSLAFLKKHRFYTKSQQVLRNKQKEINIRVLQQRLNRISH